MSLGKVAGGNEIDTNLRVLKAWSPIQTSSSSDRLTHSSKHTQRESDGTEKFADFYCSVTEPQEFTQKKKRFYRRFGICVHPQVQDAPQEISGNRLKDFLQMLAPHLTTMSEPVQLIDDALPRPE